MTAAAAVPVELTPEELADVELIVEFVWSRTDEATRASAETIQALRFAGQEAWDIIAGFSGSVAPTARVRRAVLEEVVRRVRAARWSGRGACSSDDGLRVPPHEEPGGARSAT